MAEVPNEAAFGCQRMKARPGGHPGLFIGEPRTPRSSSCAAADCSNPTAVLWVTWNMSV